MSCALSSDRCGDLNFHDAYLSALKIILPTDVVDFEVVEELLELNRTLLLEVEKTIDDLGRWEERQSRDLASLQDECGVRFAQLACSWNANEVLAHVLAQVEETSANTRIFESCFTALEQ